MGELNVVERQQVNEYTGGRDMADGRRLRIAFTDGGIDNEVVLDEVCPDDETWNINFNISKSITRI